MKELATKDILRQVKGIGNGKEPLIWRLTRLTTYSYGHG